MQVGDLVRSTLTEQIGIVLAMKPGLPRTITSVQVLWTTQGDSIFGPGSKEWSNEKFLDVLTTA